MTIFPVVLPETACPKAPYPSLLSLRLVMSLFPDLVDPCINHLPYDGNVHYWGKVFSHDDERELKAGGSIV